MSEFPRHVVMHYAGYRYGGIERVITLQVPLLRRLGCRVSLLIDGLPPPPEAHVPQDCEIVLLSPEGFASDRVARRRRLADFLEKSKADVYYEHSYRQAYEGSVDDDLQLARSLGMRVVCHWHTSFSRYLEFSGDPVARFEALANLLDVVVCLARVDACYFGMRGLRTLCIPNPTDPELVAHARCPHGEFAHRLVWCGRFSDVKNPIDAVRIAALVTREHPDTKLLFVGAPDDISERSIRDAADQAGVDVAFAGQVRDVYGLFESGGVFLSTSQVEGFLMVLLEAMACGLPVVCYDLPYLEILRQCEDVRRVPQRDVVAAAHVVCELFRDRDTYRRISDASRAFVVRFAESDLLPLYESALRGAVLACPSSAEDVRLALDELDAARARQSRAMAREIMSRLPVGLMAGWCRPAARVFRKAACLLPGRPGRAFASLAESAYAAIRVVEQLKEGEK